MPPMPPPLTPPPLKTSPLKPGTRDKLRQVSTATLATALFKRGLRHQMVQDVRPLSPLRDGSMVGEAYTLRYIPAREDFNGLEVFRNPGRLCRLAAAERSVTP